MAFDVCYSDKCFEVMNRIAHMRTLLSGHGHTLYALQMQWLTVIIVRTGCTRVQICKTMRSSHMFEDS